jgi:hypothetical protein
MRAEKRAMSEDPDEAELRGHYATGATAFVSVCVIAAFAFVALIVLLGAAVEWLRAWI